MAIEEYVGAIVMEVDGAEIDIVSFNPSTTTGREIVATMNSSGNALGFSEGMTMHSLSVTAAIPKAGHKIDWAKIKGAKISMSPIGGGLRVSYLDCFSISTSESYQVQGQARIDIQMAALRKVEE